MSYPFQITSLEQYNKDYKSSTENPEKFWADVTFHVAENLGQSAGLEFQRTCY